MPFWTAVLKCKMLFWNVYKDRFHIELLPLDFKM